MEYNSYMEPLILNVKDLEAAERQRYESLLGQQLADDQQIVLAVVPTSSDASHAQQSKAWAELEQLSQKAEKYMQSAGITPQQWEATVDEACNEVRYGESS